VGGFFVTCFVGTGGVGWGFFLYGEVHCFLGFFGFFTFWTFFWGVNYDEEGRQGLERPLAVEGNQNNTRPGVGRRWEAEKWFGAEVAGPAIGDLGCGSRRSVGHGCAYWFKKTIEKRTFANSNKTPA